VSDCVVVVHLVAFIYVAVVFTNLREVTVLCDVDLIQMGTWVQVIYEGHQVKVKVTGAKST